MDSLLVVIFILNHLFLKISIPPPDVKLTSKDKEEIKKLQRET